MSPEPVVGWDVGGAHLKAALLGDHCSLRDVVQHPTPLWMGLQRLDEALTTVTDRWPEAGRHLVTMTGELADAYPDRPTGVDDIARRTARVLGPGRVRVYAGHDGWVLPGEARSHAASVASANWLASADLVARNLPECVWMDVGSTTTDVVPIRGGRVCASGYSDAERLRDGELVYTGIVRTPVCAVADRVPFDGRWQSLASEVFATMADVYRVLGRLPAGADQMETPDGREKTVSASAVRLARMLGRDAGDLALEDWVRVALYLARRQKERLRDALDMVLSRERLSDEAPVVVGGAGAFLARELASEAGRSFTSFSAVCKAPAALADAAATCAPAVAVALLGAGEP